MNEDLKVCFLLPSRFVWGVLMFLFYEIPRDIKCKVAHTKYRTDDYPAGWIRGERIFCSKCGQYQLFSGGRASNSVYY